MRGAITTFYAQHRVLVLGQLISLLITCTGIFTQFLNQSYEIQIPVTQSAGNYLLLCVYLVYPVMMYRTQPDYSLEIAWWKYALLALADVEGNFLVVCAYQFTSISSAMLLDCFTIPVVMLLSSMFLNAQYSREHFVAVAFCLGGISVLVISDIIRDAEDWSSSSWSLSALYGDFLCLLGSAIYACSNVAQEYLVKKKNRRLEFLGMVGLCGFVISSIQAYLFEGAVIAHADWSSGSVLCLLGYVVTLFVMYSFTSVFMKTGDAAVFNLSLLTSDFFAVVAARFLFNEHLSSLYFVGFTMIVIGIVIYNRSPPPTTSLDDKMEAAEGTTATLLPSHHI
ncbi:hypothetical protein Poli38472_000351 [Pythium oligandrum]|uniref:Solute carrier family 35 member F2 n=1 Tax=Pythium oligandrum TaxID=41045 RepID=A0A8K1CBH7_PYTOL|nr:hypothetical protein Poli38472_000351 [Pythium oligandrum]|eukprot:TMW60309.1 hypothetical protein Poli38472_000351 [Pythium oligandrum]